MNSEVFWIWFKVVGYCFVYWIAYKWGKLNGFSEGFNFMRKNMIRRSAEEHDHWCSITNCNVVCFEREGELWVKEFSGYKEPEGRTYMVFYCPWCGYQTEKSKMHEKVKINRKENGEIEIAKHA